jgi:hypothetical protein
MFQAGQGNYIQVPDDQRDEYRMVHKTISGKEVVRKVCNSDLVMLNQFFYTLKDELYTTYHQTEFF